MVNKFLNNLATPENDWKEENEREDKSTEKNEKNLLRQRKERILQEREI